AAVDQAVKSAFEISSHMPEDEYSQLLQFNSFVYPNIDAHDRKGRQTPTKDKAEMAKHLENECIKNDKRIKGVRSASVSETVTEMTLLDSNSDPIHHQETLYTASITCRAEEGTDNQTGSDFDFSNYLESLNLAQVGKRAAEYALELLGATSAPT